MAQPTRTKITADEFFALPEYAEHTRIELIDGEVVIHVSAIPKHQFAADEILYYLKTYARKNGGHAISAPVAVVLDDENVFEPDVLYLAPDSACTIGEKRLFGPPELVVEVLSPRTAKYDRIQKFETYQKHGVREYWIVDPANETLELFRLNDEGRFALIRAYAKGDTFTSAVLGEEVAMNEFFRDES